MNLTLVAPGGVARLSMDDHVGSDRSATECEACAQMIALSLSQRSANYDAYALWRECG